jgi:hypothetical protein
MTRDRILECHLRIVLEERTRALLAAHSPCGDPCHSGLPSESRSVAVVQSLSRFRFRCSAPPPDRPLDALARRFTVLRAAPALCLAGPCLLAPGFRWGRVAGPRCVSIVRISNQDTASAQGCSDFRDGLRSSSRGCKKHVYHRHGLWLRQGFAPSPAPGSSLTPAAAVEAVRQGGSSLLLQLTKLLL